MKIRNLLYRYVWMALVMVAVYACSEQEDLSQLANRPEPNGTRTAEWKTKTVTLDAVGTLEAKLTEAMAGEELSTLEKLVVSGPMAAVDFNYLEDNLSGLYALDLKDVTITALDNGDNGYYGNYSYAELKNDTICRYMFAGRSYLREIILPENLKGLEEYAFYNCDSLTSVIVPDGVKLLRNSTFRNCRRLSDIALPENLEGIESQVFYDCDSLKSIVIPEKVKYIGGAAFARCHLLTSAEFSANSELDSIAYSAFDDTNLKSIKIPDKVRKIGYNSFYSCDSLMSVVLPTELEGIETYAFHSCRSLQSIVIPNKVKYIGESAFANCRSLASVDFASISELDSIASSAFYSCGLLSSVVLPSGLKTIGSMAFSDCYTLSSINFPSSLKTISNYAFQACNSLVNVSLPSGLETIEGYAFHGCEQLTQLTIPETVNAIGEGFANACHKLRNVIWNALVDVPYNWCNDDCFLYVNTELEIAVNESWKNVIINGVAQSAITIRDFYNEFSVFQEFTAPEVVYKRHFGEETVPGGSSGWQTIVLPFTPDSIYHESKGRVAPFNSDIENTKPFWLRELTSDGFVDVTTMTPDKPYIIAMPNSSDYLDEYCLNGEITFTAKNVTLAKTPETLEPSVGPNFELHPTYDFVKKALYIYALSSKGDDYDGRWYYKNFFIRSASDIYPFNAYVTTLGGGRSSKSEFDLDTRSSASRVPYKPNKTGIPQIGDM